MYNAAADVHTQAEAHHLQLLVSTAAIRELPQLVSAEAWSAKGSLFAAQAVVARHLFALARAVWRRVSSATHNASEISAALMLRLLHMTVT